MQVLTTKSILDAAQSMIVDQSAGMRARMLTWLNLAMQSVVNEPREWEFLKKSAPLTITDNTITLPDDFADFVSLTIGTTVFTASNQLTETEATKNYRGFTIDAGTLTICPGSTDTTATLKYKATVPLAGYTDNTNDTIFPAEFKPCFVRYLVTLRNEFDVEDQFPLSLQLSDNEMRMMKALDNKRKAIPKPNRHGYIRGR